jgi:hypothetical protein
MKQIRPKIIKAKLEKELERYSKRIQKLASKAYQIRTMLEDIAAMELREEIKTGGQDLALHSERTEGSTGSRTADSDSGQLDLSLAAVNQTVLAEQPAELQHDSPDIGLVEGSGV